MRYQALLKSHVHEKEERMARPSKSNLRKGPGGKSRIPKAGKKANATSKPSACSTRGQMSHTKSY